MSEDRRMISDEAVEAAAKVLQAQDDTLTYPYPVTEYMEEAKAILEAAAPYIKAQAWEDAADAIEAKRVVPELDQYYVAWLKTQAETIREGRQMTPDDQETPMNNPVQRPLPVRVHDSFTYACTECGGTVTVVSSTRQPHACNGLANAWDKGRSAGQMDPYGLYPTTNPYRSQA